MTDLPRETSDTAHDQPPRPGKDSATSSANDWFAYGSGTMLDRAETLIYVLVGILFLLGTLFALGYSCWDAVTKFSALLPLNTMDQSSAVVSTIIKLIENLLLVLIMTEVLGTVIHYLKAHVTSLRPFLFIGIISATRGILSISAQLSVGKVDNFLQAMLELGVYALIVLFLGITLRLLGNNYEIGPDV